MVIIPTADLGLSDSAFPASEITNRTKMPAIRINVVKYASLIRGDRACLRRGLLHWKDLKGRKRHAEKTANAENAETAEKAAKAENAETNRKRRQRRKGRKGRKLRITNVFTAPQSLVYI